MSLDIDATGQRARTAANPLLGTPIEQQMRSTARATMFTRDDRIVLSNKLVPFGDAVGVFFSRYRRPGTRSRCVHPSADRSTLSDDPRHQALNDDRITRRLVDAASPECRPIGFPVGSRSRAGIGCLAFRVERKDREAVRRICQRRIDHLARLFKGSNCRPHCHPQTPSCSRKFNNVSCRTIENDMAGQPCLELDDIVSQSHGSYKFGSAAPSA